MDRHAITINTLRDLKARGEPATCVALYDAPLAAAAERAGVEILLVGDSLAMTVQGRSSTLPATMEQMVYHTEAVARGSATALIIADMPFMSYASVPTACENAGALMRAGAHMVKLEGGAWLAPTIATLRDNGVPCCVHLGLTPQSVHLLGGYKVRGRGAEGERILDDMIALDAVGAACMLLECVPLPLAERAAQRLAAPVIGIGAGAADAQVLVANDLLGITANPPKFSHNFLADAGGVEAAFAAFVAAVKERQFPQPVHCFK